MQQAELNEYHLQELAIAQDPAASGHILPPLSGNPRRVLDVGCGAGQTLIACALPPQVLAYGVDVDSTALALGRSLNDRIRFVCSQAESLPFADEQFDLVISRVALPYTNIRSSLAEIERVLAPGGTMWAVLHPLSTWAGELRRHLARGQVKGLMFQLCVLANGLALHCVGRQFRIPFGGTRFESFQTAGGMRRALLRSGFSDISVSRGRFFVVTATKPRLSRDA